MPGVGPALSIAETLKENQKQENCQIERSSTKLLLVEILEEKNRGNKKEKESSLQQMFSQMARLELKVREH